ncbi:MAG TPA: hypothetical protein GX700_09420 [Paracoccus sp.]|nr:hypothetical protein [Paracoccus sp. (in: a-proteobacteria)]
MRQGHLALITLENAPASLPDIAAALGARELAQYVFVARAGPGPTPEHRHLLVLRGDAPVDSGALADAVPGADGNLRNLICATARRGDAGRADGLLLGEIACPESIQPEYDRWCEDTHIADVFRLEDIAWAERYRAADPLEGFFEYASLYGIHHSDPARLWGGMAEVQADIARRGRGFSGHIGQPPVLYRQESVWSR